MTFPRVLSEMASYDVASTIRRALLSGVTIGDGGVSLALKVRRCRLNRSYLF
jgi:hypothetical protein